MPDEERAANREAIPFDEAPPVDPSVPQVGNSKARFVMPDEEQDPTEEETGESTPPHTPRA